MSMWAFARGSLSTRSRSAPETLSDVPISLTAPCPQHWIRTVVPLSHRPPARRGTCEVAANYVYGMCLACALDPSLTSRNGMCTICTVAPACAAECRAYQSSMRGKSRRVWQAICKSCSCVCTNSHGRRRASSIKVTFAILGMPRTRDVFGVVTYRSQPAQL